MRLRLPEEICRLGIAVTHDAERMRQFLDNGAEMGDTAHRWSPFGLIARRLGWEDPGLRIFGAQELRQLVARGQLLGQPAGDEIWA